MARLFQPWVGGGGVKVVCCGGDIDGSLTGTYGRGGSGGGGFSGIVGGRGKKARSSRKVTSTQVAIFDWKENNKHIP